MRTGCSTRRSPNSVSKLGVATVAALALLIGACSSGGGATDTAKPGNSSSDRGQSKVGEQLSGAITVSAAASLTESFTKLQQEFEAANPDAKVHINFGSSGQLSKQIQAGAPVDVAAFADTQPMDSLASADLLENEAETFVHNKLVIVTKTGNPERIKGLADLASAGTVALCVETAPCGKFAAQALESANVWIEQSKITRAQNVKATLGAVAEGDAVAGIVYVTDAAENPDVDSVPIPDNHNVLANYPIAVVKGSAHPQLARAFVDFVLGAKGQKVLREFGFLPA